ncbi:MAG: hypothetical protein HY401_06195 [Elusimicrobia bacterium]|nr:hypothetical protein [Elusimicrobiota bacterium]
MKRILLTLISLSLFINACSKAPEDEILQEEREPQKEEQPKYFQGTKYPVRVNFIEGISMKAEESSSGSIIVRADAAPHFPQLDLEGGLYTPLLTFTIYGDNREWFKKRIFGFPIEPHIKEAQLNNIPVLAYSYTSSKQTDYYIFLIPGIYAGISFSGCKTGEPVCDWENDLRQKMVHRITWLKPIDTNSQEFKDWKAHILSLIKK